MYCAVLRFVKIDPGGSASGKVRTQVESQRGELDDDRLMLLGKSFVH